MRAKNEGSKLGTMGIERSIRVEDLNPLPYCLARLAAAQAESPSPRMGCCLLGVAGAE